MKLHHGGNLVDATRRFGAPDAGWLDLSTGISPWSWPVPVVPERVWRNLPYPDGELERIAADYFGAASSGVLATPGSQFAISTVPALVRKGRVAMPSVGYAEHHHAWICAGHQPIHYDDESALVALADGGLVDHAVIINPNNPTGTLLPQSTVSSVSARLASRDGCTLVDEAFVDPVPGYSSGHLCGTQGLVVLRSLGKFFGLAGVRLGFCLGSASILGQLEERMGPWLVNHAARWIGERALEDTEWHALQRARLEAVSVRWHSDVAGIVPSAAAWTRNALFSSVQMERARALALFESMADRGVLIRLFELDAERALIRLGLPGEEDYHRAIDALQAAVGESLCC